MEGRTLGKVNLKGDTLRVHRDPRNNGNKTCEDSEAIGKRLLLRRSRRTLKRFGCLMHLFMAERSPHVSTRWMDGRPWELMVCVVPTSPCSDVNGFVLSLLPELGTMGSKRGEPG